MSQDKKHLFEVAWRAYGAPAIVLEPEYFFVPERRFRADFAIISDKLLIEVDGGQYLPHGGRHNTDKDREKLNFAAVYGWRVIRFSTQQLERNPLACVDVVLQALGLEVERE